MSTSAESTRAYRVGYFIGSTLAVAAAGIVIGIGLALLTLAALSLLRADRGVAQLITRSAQ